MSSNKQSDSMGSAKLSEDTFNILIATDIHLGYEQSRKRASQGQDSFTTFEEILQYAKEYNVDFILLGGDLFHDSKPSQAVVERCMNLLRKYCLGTRKNRFQFLSDPEFIFKHCSHKTVNFEDPNLNVSIPVFSIHGNHDDPSFGTIGSLDLLSVTGLVNYFGKWTDLNQVTIAPLVFKKGESYIALYGLGYLNDERLSRIIRDYKLNMLRPKELESSDCFNMFVLHQNRVKRSEYAYIPEHKLPNFLNLVLWGHEHECRISPEFVDDTKFHVCQPGSSIATSLCEGEAVPKHVGLLSVNRTNFKIKKLKLQTVRPFVFRNLVLREQDIRIDIARKVSDCVFDFVDRYIEHEMIPAAVAQLTKHPRQPTQPLLRLRIFYNNEDQVFETIRIGQKYCDDVANPMDIILFRKEKVAGDKRKLTDFDDNDEMNDMAEAFGYGEDDRDWSRTVQGGIRKYFELPKNKNSMTVLSVTGLNEALNRFVEKGDNDAFRDIVRHQMKKTVEYVKEKDAKTEEEIFEEIKNFRDARLAAEADEKNDVCEVLDSVSRRGQGTALVPKEEHEIEPSDEEAEDYEMGPPVATKRGRGRARGTRGTTTTRARGRGSRGRGKAAESARSALDVTVSSPPPAVAPRRRGRESPQKAQVQTTLSNFGQRNSPRRGPERGRSFFLDDSDSD